MVSFAVVYVSKGILYEGISVGMMNFVENDMEYGMVTFANIRELENNMSTNKSYHEN